jgi:hypothetical protein
MNLGQMASLTRMPASEGSDPSNVLSHYCCVNSSHGKVMPLTGCCIPPVGTPCSHLPLAQSPQG